MHKSRGKKILLMLFFPLFSPSLWLILLVLIHSQGVPYQAHTLSAGSALDTRRNNHEVNDKKIVSVLVYLDNVEDTRDNQELVSWTAHLIQANILVEYLTGDQQMRRRSSALVEDIVRTNCALRPLPSEVDSSHEVLAQVSRYIQKFDLVLVLACTSSEESGGGGRRDGSNSSSRECWARVRRVLSHSRYRQSASVATTEDILSINDSYDDAEKANLMRSAAKTILYIPKSAEESIGSTSSGSYSGSGGVAALISCVSDNSAVIPIKTVDVIMTQSRVILSSIWDWLGLQLNDGTVDGSLEAVLPLVVMEVAAANTALQVTRWSVWYVFSNQLNAYDDWVTAGGTDTLGAKSLLRGLVQDFFQQRREKEEGEGGLLGGRPLSSSHVDSFDVPVTHSPILLLDQVPPRTLTVLIHSATYAKSVLFSYLSRSYPYHRILICTLSLDLNTMSVSSCFDSDEKSVFALRATNASHDSSSISTVEPDIIVWSYGYIGLMPNRDHIDEDAQARFYVQALFHQFNLWGKNVNIIFLSGEAKEYISFFGEDSYLPRAMIEATFSVSSNSSHDDGRGFAGIMFLNTVKDESYYPTVNTDHHCANQPRDCIPMSYMFHLATASSQFFESFDPTAPYTPKNPETKEAGLNVLDLLKPRGRAWAIDQLRGFKKLQNSVAYLYTRCDRPEREEFFRLLLAEELGLQGRVHALGRCNGDVPGQPNFVTSELRSRDDHAYAHSAATHYKSYKFVVAFENEFVEGYITEKLLLPYFANAVPIYMGAPDVHDYFRRESMINCNDFASLQDCAQYVAHVNRHQDVYLSILQEAPMVNMSKWCELFNWHPLALDKCRLEDNYRIVLAMRRNFRIP